jgi:hypothetical protein
MAIQFCISLCSGGKLDSYFWSSMVNAFYISLGFGGNLVLYFSAQRWQVSLIFLCGSVLHWF